MIRILLCIVLLTPLIASANAAEAFFDLGRGRYAHGDYRIAVKYLQHSIELDPESSDAHLWLGKAYGRLAEILPWYQAVDFAEKSGESLKKSVDLNGRNILAIETLVMFYEQAPAFLGGSADKATELKTRLQALQTQ